MVKPSDRAIQAQRQEFQTRCAMTLCFTAGALLLLSQAQPRWQEQPHQTFGAPSSGAKAGATQLLLQNFGAQALRVAFPQQATRVVVDLSDRRVYVHKNDTTIASYPVAIGQAGWETPQGDFSVMYMQENPIWRHPITGEWIFPGAHNPLGARWIGFWSDGVNQIGFHGTNQDGSIGQAVSHGCIRMYNEDIQELYQHVMLGTPVSIQS